MLELWEQLCHKSQIRLNGKGEINQIVKQAMIMTPENVVHTHDGRAQPVYGFISTENPKWNNPNVAKYGYDPARARTLLAETYGYVPSVRASGNLG
jgi:hypothetical protein